MEASFAIRKRERQKERERERDEGKRKPLKGPPTEGGEKNPQATTKYVQVKYFQVKILIYRPASGWLF